jgi:hypothetical protein
MSSLRLLLSFGRYDLVLLVLTTWEKADQEGNIVVVSSWSTQSGGRVVAKMWLVLDQILLFVAALHS